MLKSIKAKSSLLRVKALTNLTFFNTALTRTN